MFFNVVMFIELLICEWLVLLCWVQCIFGGDSGVEDVIQVVWFKVCGVDDSQVIDNSWVYLYWLVVNFVIDYGCELSCCNWLLVDYYLWGVDEVIFIEEQVMVQDELQWVFDVVGYLLELICIIFWFNCLQGFIQVEIVCCLGVLVIIVENYVCFVLQCLVWVCSG